MKLLVVGIIAMITASSVMACSCEQMDAKTLLKDSEMLMFAVPTEDSYIAGTLSEDEWLAPYVMMTQFEVIKSFKNAGEKEITVISPLPLGGNCGIEFRKNSGPMIISAYKDKKTGELVTSSCDVSSVDFEEGYELLIELAKLSKK